MAAIPSITIPAGFFGEEAPALPPEEKVEDALIAKFRADVAKLRATPSATRRDLISLRLARARRAKELGYPLPVFGYHEAFTPEEGRAALLLKAKRPGWEGKYTTPALTPAPPIAPGKGAGEDIVITKNGKLLVKVIQAQNLVKGTIAMYNHFVAERIPAILATQNVDYATGHRLVVGQYRLGDRIMGAVNIIPPYYNERAEGKLVQSKLYPNRALVEGWTYEINIWATVHLLSPPDAKTGARTVIDDREPQYHFGSLPCMIYSQYCNLAELRTNVERIVALGMDPKDPGGYFITRGKERAFVTQEQLLRMKPLTTLTKEGDVSASITIETLTGSVKVAVITNNEYKASSHAAVAAKKGKERKTATQVAGGKRKKYRGVLRLALDSFYGTSKVVATAKSTKAATRPRTINALVMLRFIGAGIAYTDLALFNEQVTAWILTFVSEDDPVKLNRMKLALAPSVAHVAVRSPRKDVDHIYSKIRVATGQREMMPDEKKRQIVEDVLKNTALLRMIGRAVLDAYSRPDIYLERAGEIYRTFGEGYTRMYQALMEGYNQQRIPPTEDVVKKRVQDHIITERLAAYSQEHKYEEVTRHLTKDFFPNIPADQVAVKCNTLAYLIIAVLEQQAGYNRLDDRNSSANKSGRPAAMEMESLYRTVLKIAIKSVVTGVTPTTVRDAMKSYSVASINEVFTSSFNTGAWGIDSRFKKKNGAVELLKRGSIVLLYDNLMKMAPNINRKSTNTATRQVYVTQYGYIDFIRTQDKDHCGLTKYFAITAFLAPIEQDTLHLHINYLPWVSPTPSRAYPYPVWLVQSALPPVRPISYAGTDLYAGIKALPGVTIEWRENSYIVTTTDEGIINRLRGVGQTVSASKSATHRNAFLVNGRLVGFVDGLQLLSELHAIRRRGHLRHHSFYLDSRGILHADNTPGQFLRPLLVVENNQLVIDKKGMWDADVARLYDSGCIENISAAEQEYIKLASDVEAIKLRNNAIAIARENYLRLRRRAEEKESLLGGEVRVIPSASGGVRVIPSASGEVKLPGPSEETLTLAEAKDIYLRAASQRPYTHCEIDPSAVFTVSTAVNPAIGHQMATRSVYAAKAIGQAIGVYHINWRNRFDLSSKVHHGARPFFETHFPELIGTRGGPQGRPVRIGVGAIKGMTQEDAFIFNKRSIDAGLFRITTYTTYTATFAADTTAKNAEGISRPVSQRMEIPEKRRDQAHLESSGLPRIGSFVSGRGTNNDIVIGKVYRGPDGVARNQSVTMKVNEEGYIDDVLVTGSLGEPDEQGRRRILSEVTVKVRVRTETTPALGDKFVAAAFAQKGTIGAIIPAEDLPMMANGESCDVWINPIAIIGRMTIGYLIELIAGKFTVLTGERVSGTVFQPVDLDNIMKILPLYGFTRNSETRMYDGLTGEMMDTAIFEGFAFLSPLPHQTYQKIQARSKGAIDNATRQPTAGRSRHGGIKLGEMERDALITAGAAEVVTERYCNMSAPFEAVFCLSCGVIASPLSPGSEYVCRNCRGKTFGRKYVPYAIISAGRYLSALGIDQRILTSVDRSLEPIARKKAERAGRLIES